MQLGGARGDDSGQSDQHKRQRALGHRHGEEDHASAKDIDEDDEGENDGKGEAVATPGKRMVGAKTPAGTVGTMQVWSMNQQAASPEHGGIFMRNEGEGCNEEVDDGQEGNPMDDLGRVKLAKSMNASSKLVGRDTAVMRGVLSTRRSTQMSISATLPAAMSGDRCGATCSLSSATARPEWGVDSGRDARTESSSLGFTTRHISKDQSGLNRVAPVSEHFDSRQRIVSSGQLAHVLQAAPLTTTAPDTDQPRAPGGRVQGALHNHLATQSHKGATAGATAMADAEAEAGAAVDGLVDGASLLIPTRAQQAIFHCNDHNLW